MILYFSILAWTIACGLVFMKHKKTVQYGEYPEYRATLSQGILTFSVIIFFIGLRSGIADTPAYVIAFNDFPGKVSTLPHYLTNGHYEKGFIIFGTIIKSFISKDYHIFLLIIALISGICTMIPLYRYSTRFGTSTFIFVASCSFTWMLNGIRQYLAAAILFCCIDLILKRKTIPFLIVVLILSTLHTSVLVAIPIYFIVDGEAWNEKTLFFMAMIILILILTMGSSSSLDTFLAGSRYENASSEIKMDNGTNGIRVLIEGVPTILAFWKRRYIKKIATPVINLCINMSIISTGIYIASMFTSGIFVGRLPVYFSLYNLILLPWLLFKIFEKDILLVYYIMAVCYFAFFYYQIVITWNLNYISDILHLYL